MSVQATVQRDGDTWSLTWPTHGVAMGLERLVESRDELKAEVTVESKIGGRVLGPVKLNILSSESQTRFANALSKRVNGLKPEDWHAVVVYACAVVAKQYRQPTPTVDLSAVDTSTEVEYLIPGLVPADETTVVYADGETGKSMFVLRVAASVKLGQQLPWGDRPTKVCNVLYLDWETNARTIAGRLRRISLGMQTAVPQIHYRQCFRSLLDELPSLREEVSRKQIGLVIVDSIGYAATGSLNDDETARSAMNAMRQLSPATRIAVAHVSAETARQTSGSGRPFGSAFFWNGMRSGLELRKSEDASGDSMELGLFHRKANDGEHHKPIGINVMFDGKTGPIGFWESDVNESPDLAARTPLSSRLRALLRKGSANLDDLAEQLDVPQDTISKTLRRMPDAMKIVDGTRNKPSEWGLVSEGDA